MCSTIIGEGESNAGCSSIEVQILVISRYKVISLLFKDDIIVITRNRGGAEVECNNKDVIRVTGYTWLLSHVR